MKKDWLITFTEKGVTYMQCKKCNDYVSVSEDAKSVVCGLCNAISLPWPKAVKQYIPTGRPPGWKFMKEFVDKEGNVFHKGVEQPKLKGTLPSTKIVSKKKTKRRTKEQILVDTYNKKKAELKKAVAKQKMFINGEVKN